MLLALLCFAFAAAASGSPVGGGTRQEFLLLRGVASQIEILKLNIEAYPKASEKVIEKIYPDIVAIFDVNKNGVLETSDLMTLYPKIADYHRQFIAGKFVRLPIVRSPAEFAAGDLNQDGVISLPEIQNLIVKMVGTPLWNTAMLEFVASFDSEAAQQGYLSPAETQAIARKIMADLSGKEEPTSLANPIGGGAAGANPNKVKISVVNKMELLRKRFADPANLPFASQIIKRNAKPIYATADLDQDGKVTKAELEQVYQITKNYLERTLQRQGRMVPLGEWMSTLGAKPDGSVSINADQLVEIMTTKLTAPMWESFMACMFNLAIDGNKDGQLTMGELAEFEKSPVYKLFQLPLNIKYRN